MSTPAGRQRGVACELAGDRDADKDAHPQRNRMKGRFRQELPTAPPTTERQVSAAADVGSQNLNGSSQSKVAAPCKERGPVPRRGRRQMISRQPG